MVHSFRKYSAIILFLYYLSSAVIASNTVAILRRWHTESWLDTDNSTSESCIIVGNATTLFYHLAPSSSTGQDDHKLLKAVTHTGSCGACSSLADLAAYIDTDDLPSTWWKCGIRSLVSRSWSQTCFRHEGFTKKCSDKLVSWVQSKLAECPWEWSKNSLGMVQGDGNQVARWMFCESHNDETLPSRIREKEIQLESFLGRTPRNSGLKAIWELPSVEVDHSPYLYPNGKEVSEWKQPVYSEAVLKGLESKELLVPIPRIISDPYEDASLNTTIDEHEVCGIKYHDDLHKTYTLHTFRDEHHAAEEHAIVTHKGACGACSTLQDLAVYLGKTDLTNPVRKCAFKSFLSRDWAMSCLFDIGFSPSCADIWYWNAQHTRRKCLGTCFFSFLEKNNFPDGSLSGCIQCDEDISGPVFKKVSARTRRNSGLISAIQRPGPAVYRASHHHHSCAASDTDNDICAAPETIAREVNFAHHKSMQDTN